MIWTDVIDECGMVILNICLNFTASKFCEILSPGFCYCSYIYYNYIHVYISKYSLRIHITTKILHSSKSNPCWHSVHLLCVHVQRSLWKQLSKSSSEKFFQEIYNHFQAAEQEIKNMGLVIQSESDHMYDSLATTTSTSSGLQKSSFMSQLSFDNRDIQAIWPTCALPCPFNCY